MLMLGYIKVRKILQQHSFYNCTPYSEAKAHFSFYWQRESGHIQDISSKVDLFFIFKMLCSTVSTNQKGIGVADKEAAQEKSRSTGNKISEL